MAIINNLPQFNGPILLKLKVTLGLLIIWTAIGVYFTSLSSIILWMDGVYTDWFYLSLNYFSRAWVWVLLTPLIYKLYKNLFYSKFKKHQILGIVMGLGILVSIIHVLSSFYLDVLLRRWLDIIEIEFWHSIFSELPLIINYLSNSLITYLFLFGVFIGNDHFGFIKSFTIQQSREIVAGRAVTKVQGPHDGGNILMHPIMESATHSIPTKLMIKTEGKIRFLAPDEIRHITSKGNYLYIYLVRENILVRDTMKGMKRQLSTAKFFRVNRSTIVNLDFIKELEPWFNGEYVVRMNDGAQFKTGKAFRTQLQLLFGTNFPK